MYYDMELFSIRRQRLVLAQYIVRLVAKFDYYPSFMTVVGWREREGVEGQT